MVPVALATPGEESSGNQGIIALLILIIAVSDGIVQLI
jgi:hypothetical protein